MKQIFFFFVLLLAATCLRSQNEGMVHYSQEDGLNASVTYIIRQDKQGFIWVGSDNGLFRFDGTEFKQYSQKEGLVNIDVLMPIPMATGEVFIVPYGGDLAVMRHGRIYHAGNDPELAKMKALSGRSLKGDLDKSGGRLALYEMTNPTEIFVYENEKIRRVPVGLQISPDFRVIKYDFDSNIVIEYEKAYWNYNLFTKKRELLKIQNFDVRKYTMTLVNGEASSLFSTVDGMFGHHIGKCVNIYSNHEDRGDLYRSLVFDENIIWTYPQSPNSFWVSYANGGVSLVDPEEVNGPCHPLKFLPQYIINGAMFDRDGNAWFSTKNDGIFFMPRKQFESYRFSELGRENSYITAIDCSEENIYLGYNTAKAGIYSKNHLNEIVLDQGLRYDCRGILPGTNEVVFGSINSYKIKLSDGKVEKLHGCRYVKNIAVLRPGNGLICADDTLYQYNGSRVVKKFFGLKSYSALAYSPDSAFVGTFDAVYRMSLKTAQKKLFLSKVFFTDMAQLGNNRFIGSTNGYGICLFNNHEITRRITVADGLASDQVKRLEVQDANTVWAATNSGLSRLYLGEKKPVITTYTRMDGLPSDRVSDCVIRHDTIFVATTKGVGFFALKELLHQEKYLDKKVLINSVIMGGQEFLEPENELAVNYSDTPVIVSLSFLDYISMGNVGYLYQIEGLSDQWQTIKSPRVVLSGLSPGKYALKIYGLSYNGKRSREMTVFRFEIIPRYWQTWWFRGIWIFVLMSALIWSIQLFLRRQRDKKLKQLLYDKKIAELELQAIKAQINPHFIYNCLNSIQFLLYKKDYAETENYLGIFAQMIRSTLHYSEKTFIPIHEEIDYLRLYLDMEKLRFKSDFSFDIRMIGNAGDMEIPSLLVQPFVENAIKHGLTQLKHRKGRIEIVFNYEAPVLSIIIRDNGVGISDKALLNKKLDSFGIRLSRKRADTFRQLFNTNVELHINDLSEKGGQGTEIIINLYKS